jgi:hypothetical protein
MANSVAGKISEHNKQTKEPEDTKVVTCTPAPGGVEYSTLHIFCTWLDSQLFFFFSLLFYALGIRHLRRWVMRATSYSIVLLRRSRVKGA